MTGISTAREAGWADRNAELGALFNILSARIRAGVVTTATAKPSRFLAAVAGHPAFTQRFNARLIAVGMDATMSAHRRMRR